MSKTHKARKPALPPSQPGGAPASGPRWLFVALIAAGAMILTVAAYVLLRGGGASTQSASPAQPAKPAQPVQAGNTPQTVSGPRLSIAQESFDYGDVKVNQPIETVFRVKNVGDKPLQILDQPQVEVVEGC